MEREIVFSTMHSYFLGLSVMVRLLCGSLGRHRAEILFVHRTQFLQSFLQGRERVYYGCSYLLKAQKGLSVDVGDGASVDCP